MMSLVPKGRLNFRPVQIRFERCVGSATALAVQRPFPFCHPECNRGICSSADPSWKRGKTKGRWCFHEYLVMIGGGCGPVGPGTRMAHCRSLGCPRDDKKGRVVAGKGRLLNRGILQIKFGQLFSRPCGTFQWSVSPQDGVPGTESIDEKPGQGRLESTQRQSPGRS
jgi:hypothetical protein